MPIGKDHPWFEWSRASILKNAPTVSGVYAIFKPETWIYIGEGESIRGRLLDHLNGDNPCITRSVPTGFQYEIVGERQRVARQDQLIVQLNPACNQKVG